MVLDDDKVWPYRFVKYEDGEMVYAVCIHGVTIIDKQKSYEDDKEKKKETKFKKYFDRSYRQHE